MDSNIKLSLDHIKEIKESFDIFESSKVKDHIHVSNLKIAMMAVGLNPTEDEVQRIISQLYMMNNITNLVTFPYLSYRDFCEIVYCRLLNKNPEAECKRFFNLISQGECKISQESFIAVMERFREKLTENEIKEILATCDVDSDGKISESDFYKLMRHTNFY